ncbi:MAG: hypothetical protein NTU89_00990 [Candidatus Dependentiae bacterium]|nr:hypothetical protein [Candidatus Dependentiae bacterium]
MRKTFSKHIFVLILCFNVATNIFASQSGQYLERRGDGGFKDKKCNILKPVICAVALIAGLVVVPEVHKKMTEIREYSIKINHGFRCTTGIGSRAMLCERDNKNPDYYCEKKAKLTSAGRSDLECWYCNSWKDNSCRFAFPDIDQAVTVRRIPTDEEKKGILDQHKKRILAKRR